MTYGIQKVWVLLGPDSVCQMAPDFVYLLCRLCAVPHDAMDIQRLAIDGSVDGPVYSTSSVSCGATTGTLVRK